MIRTQHGDAEVTVERGGDAPVGHLRVDELVATVTGRVAPPLVHVDGRAVAGSTRLVDAGVGAGTVIDVDPPRGAASTEPAVVVELVQVAGPGTGSRAPLVAGVHRVGPGRRVNAPELASAPVEVTAFELLVGTDGPVAVRATRPGVRLDGVELRVDAAAPVAWTGGRLAAHGRVFELAAVGPARSRPAADAARGTTLLERRPLPGPTAAEDPVVDVPPAALGGRRRRQRRALADLQARLDGMAARLAADRRARHVDPATAATLAIDGSPPMWQHRVGDPGAAELAVGLTDAVWHPRLSVSVPGFLVPGLHVRPLAMVPLTVDLAAEHGIGLVGSPELTRPIARGLLLDAAIRRGPADLDVVVLTRPERLTSWEWVKWLPHARSTGRLALWADDVTVRAWLDQLGTGSGGRRATLVVVDDPAWWREPGAALRQLLADVAAGVAGAELWFVLLARGVEEVPPACRVVVHADAARADRTVRVEWPGRTVDAVAPSAVSTELATTVARRLARFDDPDRPVPRAADGTGDAALVVRPFVLARDLTPLERRLTRVGVPSAAEPSGAAQHVEVRGA